MAAVTAVPESSRTGSSESPLHFSQRRPHESLPNYNARLLLAFFSDGNPPRDIVHGEDTKAFNARKKAWVARVQRIERERLQVLLYTILHFLNMLHLKYYYLCSHAFMVVVRTRQRHEDGVAVRAHSKRETARVDALRVSYSTRRCF